MLRQVDGGDLHQILGDIAGERGRGRAGELLAQDAEHLRRRGHHQPAGADLPPFLGKRLDHMPGEAFALTSVHGAEGASDESGVTPPASSYSGHVPNGAR